MTFNYEGKFFRFRIKNIIQNTYYLECNGVLLRKGGLPKVYTYEEVRMIIDQN